MVELISQYLKEHRRLNIPSVGAFMVKESQGAILFSELLKKDDGVLRTLLAQRGMSEIEVAAAVDRFVFEIKHDTEAVGAEYAMEGFGALRREASGRLVFVAQPQIIEVRLEQPQEVTAAVEEVVVDEVVVEEIATPESTLEPVISPDSSTPQDNDPQYTAEQIRELYSSSKKFREEDPSVSKLSYSKRQKPLGGYTYVQDSRRGGNGVLWFGIIAAVVAVAVIGYGLYVTYAMGGTLGDVFGRNPSADVEVVEDIQSQRENNVE